MNLFVKNIGFGNKKRQSSLKSRCIYPRAMGIEGLPHGWSLNSFIMLKGY
jgi:hypothetical protein